MITTSCYELMVLDSLSTKKKEEKKRKRKRREVVDSNPFWFKLKRGFP
jgi:hypothetical protein